MNVFGVENRDTLTHKATGVVIFTYNLINLPYWSFYARTCLKLSLPPFLGQYSAKLLKKPDQCRAVYACSHLFWVDDQDGIKDGERCFPSTPMIDLRMCLCDFISCFVCLGCVLFPSCCRAVCLLGNGAPRNLYLNLLSETKEVFYQNTSVSGITGSCFA